MKYKFILMNKSSNQINVFFAGITTTTQRYTQNKRLKVNVSMFHQFTVITIVEHGITLLCHNVIHKTLTHTCLMTSADNALYCSDVSSARLSLYWRFEMVNVP